MFDFFNTFNDYEFHFNTNCIINADIVTFIEFCTERRYNKMALFMEILCNKTKAFYNDEMYATLFTFIKAILRIRRFIVNNFKKNIKTPKYINDFSLELTPLDKTCVELNINNSMYRFNTVNIIKLYKYTLQNIDEHYYLYGELPPIKNPYTNIPFSLKEHILLFIHINNYYFKINKCLPQYLYSFKYSYFDKHIYEKTNHSKLLFSSITSYLENLSKLRFKSEIRCLIRSSAFIKTRCCYKCLKRVDIKKNFLSVARLYILNSNAIYKFGDYQEKFISTCQLLNITLDLNHIRKHRRIVKSIGRRHRRPTSPVSPIINSHPFAV